MTYLFDDDEEPIQTKYSFGGKRVKLSEIESYTISFAYDYVSLGNSDICFDNEKIPAKDYHQLYYLKKEISLMQISSLINDYEGVYRFHSIDWSYKREWLFKEYAKILNVKTTNSRDYDKLPTLYQIAVYTNQKTNAPRVVGFIGNYGIFHLIWFDYAHQIYSATTN